MKYLVALAILALVPNPALANTPDELIGQAFDVKTMQPLYKEQHRFDELDGERFMKSTFTAPNGDTIATRIVKYDGDRVSAYKLQHKNINASEMVVREQNKIAISEQVDGQTKSAEIKTSESKPIIIDAGFSDYIVRNWLELKRGEKLKFDFISTAQLDSVRLRVEHVEERNGIDKFEMTLANPVFRFLIDPIEISYYSDTKQLASYQGISNIKDAGGERYSAIRIEYERGSQALASVIEPIPTN